MNGPLLRLRQAADLVGVSYQQIWAAAKAGQLATIRFSPRGPYRVGREDLDAWVKTHRQDARRIVEAPRTEIAALLPAVRRFS